MRFDYAASLPWMRQVGTPDAPALLAIAGPDALVLRGPRMAATGFVHAAGFDVGEGETVDLQLTWFPAYLTAPEPLDVDACIADTAEWWRSWARSCIEPGAYDEEVRRSLLVLRLLTHADTGGIVAAVTTSLPEDFGGARNWDYRYVWLRDAALTLESLLHHGFTREAQAWRQWLLRAIAGDPADVQIVYGLAGERRLTEWEVDTLPGYDGSSPVRVGNAASVQYQADVFGEVMIALDVARHTGVRRRRLLVVAAARTPGGGRGAPRPARFGDLGDPRARAPLHPLARDAVGGVRPGDLRGRTRRALRPGRSVAHDARADRGADRGRRLRRRPRQLRAVRGHDRGGRRPAPARADRLRGLRRPADARHRRADRGDADPRRARLPVPHRGAGRRRPRR